MAAMEHDNQRPLTPLLILIIWLVFTLGVAAVGYPKVKRALGESGVLTLLAERGQEQTGVASTRAVRVAFTLPDGTTKLYPITAVRMGGSVYHDTFEALLAGSPKEALTDGAISYIEPKTALRGVTLSNSILFVDFSAAYLDAPHRVLADRQVKATALAMSGIKGVVILVGGKPIE